MNLPLSVSLAGERERMPSLRTVAEMSGQLRDISRTGVSLVLPSMRFGDRFLITGHYPLTVMLQLPGRVITMQVAPVRYDRLKGESERTYLVGARIVEMTDADREHLKQYVQQARKRQTETLSFARDAKSI
jgi:c-di-GMP-binding flagellar brake protein YcgR